MKVLHVLAPVSMGGGETLLINLLNEKQEGIIEEIALVYSSIKFQEALSDINIKYHILRKKDISNGISKSKTLVETLINLVIIPKLIKIIENGNFDIVHAHGFPAALLVCLAKIFSKIKTVYTHHSYRIIPNKIEEVIFTKIYNSFDALTGVSNTVTDSMNNGFSKIKNKFVTVYNCIGNNFFCSNEDFYFNGLRDDKIKIVQVARFSKIKNHDIVVKAIEVLPYEIKSKIQIIFAGDGLEKKNIERYVDENNLKEYVCFLGAIDYYNVPSLLSQCQYAIFASDNEGFGLGAVECMAMGLPILAQDNSLMREIVGDSGILVEKGEFNKGIIKLINGGNSLREKCIKRSEKYKPDIIKAKYISIYKSII